ncbi:MAG: hypothetical protein V1831_04675 [Candidatus Woesearchaeota archaeon]
MYVPKRYGQSKVDSCPFCGKIATVKNNQDVPVCAKHQTTPLPDLKCSCNSYLDLRKGRFGAYFHCLNCGNINMKKALVLNPNIKDKPGTENESAEKTIYKPKQDKKEITITSDDVDVNYS